MVFHLLICELSFLVFGTWTIGSTLIPAISTKFKLNVLVIIKGLVHLNIIFSYMKFNKICNLDHPVY